MIYVKMARTTASHCICVMCNKDRRHNKSLILRRISDKAAIIFYIKKKIFIPFGSRACSQHFTDSRYLKVDEFENVTRHITRLNGDQIQKLVETLRDMCNKNNLFFNFEDIELLDDKKCLRITSLIMN